MTTEESSYIDYSTFTAPDFSPTAYANQLVLQTNNASDTQIDLSTPLSRLLFHVQEIDSHIDTLTTQNALPIVQDTEQRADASKRLLEEVETQVNGLQESYRRLEREVIERHEAAEQVRLAAQRMIRTLRLGRSVQRIVQLGRQLEGQVDGVQRNDQRSMVPAANTLLGLRQVFSSSGYINPDTSIEGEGLSRVQVVTTLRNDVIAPAERTVVAKAQQAVREFSMSGQQTYAQTEEAKSRTTSALRALYLLSPTKSTTTIQTFEPTLLISALQSYLQTALTSSLASLTRALATLPQLDRTLLDISARCQNIVALEALLETIKPPVHPLLASSADPATSAEQADGKNGMPNFLQPLLRHLDTSSLPSYFWRSMAGQMTSRVQDILSRGGVSARTLRTNRDRVREMIRECVDRGSQLPVSSAALLGRRDAKVGNWEREAAVMAQSVVGPLQR